MISKEVIEAVRIGILTDKQLDEAIRHYSKLEELLQPHGEIYHLVWTDVYSDLLRLKDYKKSRLSKK